MKNQIQIIEKKPKPDRAQQEQWVRDSLKEIVGQSRDNLIGDIFSISTLMASEGIKKGDDTMLQESNISTLYETLTDTVKNKSQKLKTAVPYAGLRSLRDDILGDLDKAKDDITSIKESAKEQQEKSKKIRDKLEVELTLLIDKIVSQYEGSIITPENSKNKFRTINEEIRKKFLDTMENNIIEMFQRF